MLGTPSVCHQLVDCLRNVYPRVVTRQRWYSIQRDWWDVWGFSVTTKLQEAAHRRADGEVGVAVSQSQSALLQHGADGYVGAETRWLS